MKTAFFESVQSLIFQIFYKYNFLLSIFLLELCWDAKSSFFLNVGISCCCIQQGS